MSGSSAPKGAKGSGSRILGLSEEFKPDLKFLNKHRKDNSLTHSMATDKNEKGGNKAIVGCEPLLLSCRKTDAFQACRFLGLAIEATTGENQY